MSKPANTGGNSSFTPIVVTDDNFEEKVLKSDVPVVVDFYANWCGPCRNIAPSLDTLAAEFGGKLVVAKVDVDKNQKWLRHYDVHGIPHLLYFHNGKLVRRHVGGVPKARLERDFSTFLSDVSERKTK